MILGDDEDGSRGSSTNVSLDGSVVPQRDVLGTEETTSGTARVVFVVDANITSYLMMGSVSPGLKSHAVTLYEAGNLGDASIAELCKDLTTLEGTKFEGELQEFANHAFSLRLNLECLQFGGVSTITNVEDTNVNVEASNKMELQSSTSEEASSLAVDTMINEEFLNSISSEAEDNGGEDTINSEIPQDNAVVVESDRRSTDDLMDSTTLSENSLGEDSNPDPNEQNGKYLPTEVSTSVEENSKRKRKYRMDILRCESLASLALATLNRLFLRDYDLLVSMVPLPSSSVLPGPAGPIHFGPPSYSSMTPWMKLVLYSSVVSEPLSVVLMKGQCLRLFPAPLASCEKALIWSWDGSTVGGLGGKLEGSLVNGNILLHCLSSLLKFSAVWVQPLSKHDLDKSGRIITLDIPLPRKNSDGAFAPLGKEMGLCAKEILKINSMLTDLSSKIDLWTIGYIRLLKLYKEKESDHFVPDDEKYEWVPLSVEFGIPLFSPNICKRVVSSQLLQADSLNEHHEAMQVIRKRLHEVCAEHQATGPVEKLLYQREHTKESSHQLINHSSGRWNPLFLPQSLEP